jgi:hypothetical protein
MAELSTRLEPMMAFITDTYRTVARGEEVIDVDSFIKELNL